jgi:hypothetical protein
MKLLYWIYYHGYYKPLGWKIVQLRLRVWRWYRRTIREWIKLHWYYWFRGGRERDRLAWELMQLNRDYLHLEHEYHEFLKDMVNH